MSYALDNAPRTPRLLIREKISARNQNWKPNAEDPRLSDNHFVGVKIYFLQQIDRDWTNANPF
jgi:hypothetical protein